MELENPDSEKVDADDHICNRWQVCLPFLLLALPALQLVTDIISKRMYSQYCSVEVHYEARKYFRPKL
jgi:hypothetical protein